MRLSSRCLFGISAVLRKLTSSKRFSGLCVLSLGMLLCLGTTPVWAQSSTAGTVTGQVTDETNAAVPGALIKLTDISTTASQTTLSNDAGRYVFRLRQGSKERDTLVLGHQGQGGVLLRT